MAEVGDAAFALDMRDPATGNLLHVRATDAETFQQRIGAASALPELAGFFGAPPAATTPASETSYAPSAPAGTAQTGVRGYAEPCDVCFKPKVKIILPKPGDKWSPFAGCETYDDAHKAARR